ncbi:SPFH domain-containing protein [Streptomyces sp. NPDC006267]|uniref:SPFH domain-containing protein n=1 Tax=Streptomyces sp. NPDC006267 TaxID=3157173 RepID=UPI0033B6BD01
MTPNDDQTPRTTSTPNPHSLDDRLPPSLFAPLGKGSPPPLFGPVVEEAKESAPPADEPPPPPDAGPPAPPAVRADRDAPRPKIGSAPPPLFGPIGDQAPPPAGELPLRPEGGEAPPPSTDGGALPSPPRAAAPQPSSAGPQLGPAASDRLTARPPQPPTPASAPDAARAPGPTSAPAPAPASLPASALSTSTSSPAPPPASAGDGSAAAERPAPVVSTPLSPTPVRPAAGGSPAGDSALGGAVAGRSVPDRAEPVRAVPLDGNLHLRPVRRARTESSAEWTPHPSYGAEPAAVKGSEPRNAAPKGSAHQGSAQDAAPKGAAGRGPRGDSPARGAVDDPGPDTELDLVLDLAPGARAASATFSVPVPVPVPASQSSATSTASGTSATSAASRTSETSGASATSATSANSGRRHAVIANETTASIPVHLLFRDDQEPAEAGALPAALARRPAAGDRAPATRRPPVPRAPQTRVRPSTRPAPTPDARLAERPGPALSGYAALLAGAAGVIGALAVLWWRGALPAGWQAALGLTPRADLGVGAGAGVLLALLATAVLLALGGLGRGRVGYAWVLTLFGDYRGSVRRTGLVWVSPLLLRRRVDVRLRHWRSEPLPAVDANGTALRVVVLVVWRIKDTVRAVLGIEDHEAYLSAQVEAAMARVLSQLPADAFHEEAPSLRDAEAVGDALTRMLKADCEPVGVEVYSAQPTGIEYAPEVAAAMQRRRIAAIDSKHRDSVLTSVVDAVDDTVNRLTTRGIVELDDYERKALVKDLTVAFYTGRSGGGDGS